MFRVVFSVVFASMLVPNWCFGVDFLNHNLNSSVLQPLCNTFCYPKSHNAFLPPIRQNISKFMFFCAYCQKPATATPPPNTQKPGTNPTMVTLSSIGTRPTTSVTSPETKKTTASTSTAETSAESSTSKQPSSPTTEETTKSN